MLLPQADIADPRLRRGLEARGATVQAVTAYHTVDYPADPGRSLAACRPAAGSRARDARDTGAACSPRPRRKPKSTRAGSHAVVAASPSAARRIHADLAPLGGCRFVAIGRSTAAEAESLGLAVASVAEEPTASGLVAAVVRSLASPPSPPHQPVAEPTAKDTMSFPTHRPRRLRTTPAMRRLTAEHRLSACGTHPARLHPGGPDRAQPHRLDARRVAAHHRFAQARRRRGRGAGRRRHHAVRHPGRPRCRAAPPRWTPTAC